MKRRMSIKRSILSIFLSAIMVFGLSPWASAAEVSPTASTGDATLPWAVGLGALAAAAIAALIVAARKKAKGSDKGTHAKR